MIRGLRESVRLTSREALRMFHLADIWATRTGTEVRLVSANDHVHSRGSAHYEGRAIDLHASDLPALARAMRDAGYRVLWNVPGHYTHVHVEVAMDEAPAYLALVREPAVAAARLDRVASRPGGLRLGVGARCCGAEAPPLRPRQR